MSGWPINHNEFGNNHTPVMIGVSSVDGETIVPVAVNPLTGALISELDAIGTIAYHLVSANTTNATNVKSSAGNLWNVQAFNNSSTIYYLKLFDKASAPNLGTDVPIKTLLIPHNSGDGAGFILPADNAFSFANGISFAITGGIADNDSSACAANAVVINFDYA